jgi:hypothetical protein
MQKKVLIVGASGLVGTGAANSFARAGWQVIAASRRRPDLLTHENVEFLALDLQDADACAVACRDLKGITHVVYTAVYELPGLVNGWTDPVTWSTLLFCRALRRMARWLGPCGCLRERASLASTTRTFTGCRKTFCALMPRSVTMASPYFGPK